MLIFSIYFVILGALVFAHEHYTFKNNLKLNKELNQDIQVLEVQSTINGVV